MTAMQIVEREFRGEVITFNADGWFNATTTAARFGKRPTDWLHQDSTQEYIAALAAQLRSEPKSLLKVKRGGRGKSDATWFHPKLAVAFARWLDVEFSVWCDLEIDGIIRGAVDFGRARCASSSTNKVMAAVLQLLRAEQGKDTASHHYSNEARLVNWALTGTFQSLDRDALTTAELHLLAKLEEKNAVLICRGVGYDARKITLEQFAIDLRGGTVALLPQQP